MVTLVFFVCALSTGCAGSDATPLAPSTVPAAAESPTQQSPDPQPSPTADPPASQPPAPSPSPSPAPTPTPAPDPPPATPPAGSTVKLGDDLGRALFPSSNWWNQDISNAPRSQSELHRLHRR